MLNVHQVRLRFIFARASYLRRLFQKAYERGIYCVTAHKLILNVSIPPWMAVVPRRNEICVAQISQVNNVQGCTLFTVPAVNLSSRLVSAPSISKGLRKSYNRMRLLKMLNVSELPRRAVVPSGSKFAPANL